MNTTNPKNPYFKQPPQGTKPLVLKIPTFEFENAAEIEQELLPNEICLAKVPNPRTTGFKNDVALVCKDDEGNTFSIQMMQHNGELKDTPENHAILKKTLEAQNNDKSQ